jgi:hypothetical protein
MTLEHAFFISQIVAAIAVVLSLLFVAREIRENTHDVQRGEHNSTMEQWTVIRMAMAKDRDLAGLIALGLDGRRSLDRVEQLRLEQLFQEIAWAAFHIWDRTQRGIFPKGTFEFTGGRYLCAILATPRGASWWQRAKHLGFIPDYVAAVDSLLSLGNAMPVVLDWSEASDAGNAAGPVPVGA